jgi:feruloyl esterase
VSVWHGSADATVKPANADEIVKQWADVHGLGAAPSAETTVEGHRRRVWRNAEGESVLESYTIAGMAHGTPIAAGRGDGACGEAAPFILDVGISSTWRIAEFWDLTSAQPTAAAAEWTRAQPAHAARAPNGAIVIDQEGHVLDASSDRAAEPRAENDDEPGEKNSWPPRVDPGSVITKALRAAGLMK